MRNAVRQRHVTISITWIPAIYLFSKTFIGYGPTRPPFQWVAGFSQGSDINHSPVTTAEDTNEYSYTPTPHICIHGVNKKTLRFTSRQAVVILITKTKPSRLFREIQRTNTRKPRTLFWLRCTDSTCAADSTYQTPLTLSNSPTVAPKPVPRRRKSVSSVCCQVTACFTSPSFGKSLPARRFLRGPKRRKSLDARAKLQGGSPTACQPQRRTHSSVSSDPSKSTTVTRQTRGFDVFCSGILNFAARWTIQWYVNGDCMCTTCPGSVEAATTVSVPMVVT